MHCFPKWFRRGRERENGQGQDNCERKKKWSRPEIAEGVFGPALTTGMHEETASIPLFQDTGGLSDPHVGPANRPSPPPAILSLPATTVAHTEQPQIYNPTEKNMRQIAAFGAKAEVEEMSCWWSCFVSCFATVRVFASWFIAQAAKTSHCCWCHCIWRMLDLLCSSHPQLF